MTASPSTTPITPARLMNLSQDLMGVVGFDGYLKKSNPAWEKTLQYSQKELTSQPLIDFIHQDDQSRILETTFHLTSQDESIQYETRLIAKDGSIVWLQWQANSSLEEEMIYVVARDISQQKEAEQAAKSNEMRFQLVFEHAPIGMAIISPDGYFVRANQHMLDIFGYSDAQFKSLMLADLSHPDDLSDMVAPMQKWQSDSQDVIEFEQRCNHRTGFIVWALFTISRAYEQENGGLFYLVQAQDITERKVVVNQLKEVNQVVANFSARVKQLHRLSTYNFNDFEELFADYLAVGCAIFRQTTGIISKIEGSSYTIEAIHTDLPALYKGQQFDLKDTYCEQVVTQNKTIAMGNVGAMEGMAHHPAYTNLNLKSYIGTLIFVNGEPFGTLNFSSTETHPQGVAGYEYELIELMADSLGRYIALHQAEHARDIASEALAHKTQELLQSNQELTEFAYIVSHDVRAPLRALRTYSQFLEEDFDDVLGEKGKLYLDGIRDNANHLDALVVALLTYSRIGRVKAPLEEIDTGELIWEIVRSRQFEEEANWIVPASMPTVAAHLVRLEQIFSNLFSNAIKFRQPNHKPTIEIDWQELEDHWEFSVSDNGIGIPEKYLERIFGIFQRLHTQDEYEGTGIGLAIVKKAVAEHQGDIHVTSSVGEKTTFTFTLAKKKNP